MKKILIATAAVVLLSGAASAASNTHHKHMKRHHSVTHMQRPAVTTDGYSVGAPSRDPGRYSNLPGKDALNSKARIQDH